ncbi:MAG TPA: ArgE/DapE family deacylase [Candidatus Binatia bacterium]|nr:ArgE/DapE family deacylase [Candidatus Binatia bacterium]
MTGGGAVGTGAAGAGRSLRADERAAIEAVDGAWAIDALARLVRTPSITGDEGPVQELVVSLLAEAGADVERLEPDPAAVREDADWPGEEVPRVRLPIVLGRLGRKGGRRIVLVGHVDVVPEGDLATWDHDPWSAHIDGDRLHGRGACDMKGGVASILAVVKALRDSGLAERIDGELVVASVPSEEDGGQGMLAAIRAGVTGDMAVITEPTGLDLVIAHAGAITFRLTVPGRAAHASVRREGVSALEKLQMIAKALEADEAARNAAETDPLMTAHGLPYATIIGTVHGGNWASTVIDRIVVEGRYGVKLGQTWRDAERDLRRVIDDANESDPFLREHPATVEITGGRFSSSRVPADHPLPVGLGAAVTDVLGRECRVGGEPYGADMRLLIHHGDTPTVIFGPGDKRLAHSANEWVSTSEVVDCARVLAAWLVRELVPAEGL